MTAEVYLFKPNANEFDSIVIEAKDILAALADLQDGRKLRAKSATFTYCDAKFTGDFPLLDLLVPVLTPRAWEALESLVGPYCKVQEIRVQKRNYFALSVHHLVDCLDQKKSKLQYFRERIKWADEIALVESRIDGAPIFRIKHIERQALFLSSEFMSVVREQGLKGLHRVRVWPKKAKPAH